MFNFMMKDKKEKKPKEFGIYFTEKDLNDMRLRKVLLNLVETKINTQFLGKKQVIIGEAEYIVIKRSGSGIVDYSRYKKRGVKKMKIDGAVEVGKYKGRRLLLKK